MTTGKSILSITNDDLISEKKVRILVADDDKFFLNIYEDLIKEYGYESLGVDNGLEVLEKVTSFQPDIVILDVVMPGMNGFEVTRRLKEDPLTAHIPVVIVTSLNDKTSRVEGLECGADEFLTKPIESSEFSLRIGNLIKVKRYSDYLTEHGKILEGQVEAKTIQLEKAFEQVKLGYIETVYRLTLAAEYRDKETGSHIKSISLYSQMLARYLGLPESQVEAIYFASPMHDIGKIGISDSILLKPGKHTEEEFEIMMTHSTIGGKILNGSDSEILNTAEEIALCHHERWDGLGYPRGLKGDEIPVSGRIVLIADIYDAIRSSRPYKRAMSHKQAIAIIESYESRFDPVIFHAFKECHTEFKRLFEENQSEELPTIKDLIKVSLAPK